MCPLCIACIVMFLLTLSSSDRQTQKKVQILCNIIPFLVKFDVSWLKKTSTTFAHISYEKASYHTARACEKCFSTSLRKLKNPLNQPFLIVTDRTVAQLYISNNLLSQGLHPDHVKKLTPQSRWKTSGNIFSGPPTTLHPPYKPSWNLQPLLSVDERSTFFLSCRLNKQKVSGNLQEDWNPTDYPK